MTASSLDPFSLAALVGLLALLPVLVVSMTSFLKVSVVLMLLRQALGTQQIPPSMALYAIALAMTAYIMAPTLERMIERSSTVQHPKNLTETFASLKHVAEPLRDFLNKHTPDDERSWFLANAAVVRDAKHPPADVNDFSILVPSFTIAELRRGFEIGIIIYLPFVIIDIVIANILMALGMQMVQPQSISIPLKLLLFVAIDGWGRLLHALAISYA